jgi:hypothetical protein
MACASSRIPAGTRFEMTSGERGSAPAAANLWVQSVEWLRAQLPAGRETAAYS